MKAAEAVKTLKRLTRRSRKIESWDDWLAFKRESEKLQWLYLYAFNSRVYAWGKSTQSSDRLRKAGLFHEKLTGKYDRRVDYLMLKKVYGMPEVWVFEAHAEAIEAESEMKRRFGQDHCYRGLVGANRREVSQSITKKFKKTQHWRSLTDATRSGFNEYLELVYFAMLRHPKNPKRTFYWGDSLEPGFLRTIGLKYLEPAVEQALGVRF